ncbi:TetR/AcrR family transcriptional regulator C-terminal domain-containing protein [Kitasatospora aburaviensis]
MGRPQPAGRGEHRGTTEQAAAEQESIARAALDAVDEQGADGLTMRAVADRLGVKAASLYNHVSGKDELIDALAELVNAEIDLGPLAPATEAADATDAGGAAGSGGGADGDWRAGVAAYARGYRAAFLRHPHTIALLARRRVGAERQLLGYDTLLAALGRAGLTPPTRPRRPPRSTTWCSARRWRPSPPDSPGPPPSTAPATRPWPAPWRPPPSSGAGRGAPGLDERGFELALRLLLDGLAARPV